MPAPLYPATHSQWLQKGGKLGEWKHPEKLKHDAFVVFQIEQATGMCVCVFVFISLLALHRCPPHPLVSQRGGMPDGSIGRRKGPRTSRRKNLG